MAADWPRYVDYFERLAPDAVGQPTLIQVEQPQSRADAFDLVATIDRLARDGNMAEWRALVRQFTATNYYVTNLFLSGGQRIDPFTGRVEADCDFQWHHAHEVQHEGEGKINTSFRGGWKCMDGETLVVLSSGETRKLRDLRVGDSLVSYDSNGKATHGNVEAFVPTGVRPVRAFKTNGGRTFSITDDHRILTSKGWVTGADIKVGDWVGVPRSYNRIPTTARLSTDQGRVLGAIVADGCTCCGCKSSVQWTNADPEVIRMFFAAATACGYRPSIAPSGKYKYYVGGVWRLCEEFGIHGVKSIHKRLPSWFFAEPEEVLWAFIGAFIDCDGYVPHNRSRILITLANRGLLEDIRTLLDSLGVSSQMSLEHVDNGFAGYSVLSIGGLTSLEKVRDNAGIVHTTKLNRLNEAIARLDVDEDFIPNELWQPHLRKSPWSYRDLGIGYCGPTRCTGRGKILRYAEAEDSDGLRMLAESELRWEPVKRIYEVREAETFDIEVSNHHCFIGSGVISHNSHWTTYVGATCKVVVNPDRVMAIASHQKESAAKHGLRLMLEWERNVELKAAWPDVFFQDPKKDPQCPLWNQETGCTVRRKIPAVLPSLSWWAIEHVPTGARISDFFFDDIEVEDTVETDEQRSKLLRRFSSFKKTAGRGVGVYIDATAHHPNGLVANLLKSPTYGHIFHAAEDLDRPDEAPDIAALYDACGGQLVNRETGEVKELPVAIRDVRLEGPPVYHHPLELAMMRLDALDVPGGLDDYRRQMLGDIVGSEKRLKVEWVRYYTVRPEEMALGAFLYICVDPSKGVGDPTHARVEACRADGTIAWVGGLRKKIPPSDFGREMWLLGCLWEGIGTLKEYRFEEAAQSTWSAHFIAYCESRRHWPGGIGPANVKEVGGRALNWGGGAGQKRMREWLRLEPMYRNGKRLWPADGMMMAEDETGRRFDLMAQYRDEEYEPFPMPMTDDGLDSDALLMVPNDPKRGIWQLEFPETDEAAEMRERVAYRHVRRRVVNARDEGNDSWMHEGI